MEKRNLHLDNTGNLLHTRERINGCFITFCYNSSPFPSPSSSNFSAIAVKPKLSLLSLPSPDTPLKALKPSRSSTIRVFAAPEVLDSQETIDGPDSSAPEVGELVDSGSSPLTIGADAEKMDSCKQIMDASRTTNAKTMDPVPSPSKKRIYCVLKSPHVHKDARFHFEIRTHQRLIDILYPTAQTIDFLMQLDLPAGVDVEVKL
ncbi:unnamed protein product [Camellia sinensis]